MSKDPNIVSVAMASSAISFITYNKKTGDSTIEFVTGGKVEHKKIPLDILSALLAAPSAGAYYNANIRGRYA